MKKTRPAYFLYTAFCLIICLISQTATAQSTDVAGDPKNRHFVVYAGIGPNYYFNNLVIGKAAVNEFNYTFSGRIMWEPEHLLSIGIESGYFRLYNIKQPSVKIVNSAIPIQMVISMKFLKSFYTSFALGRSILLNKVESDAFGNLDANSISLADMSVTLGYKHRMNNRITLGTEAKLFYSAKANDKNISLLFVCGYRIK